MQVNSFQGSGLPRLSPPSLSSRSRSRPEEASEGSPDSVELSSTRAAVRPAGDDRKFLKIVGLGLMAAGRMISMVPGPSAPGVVCAQEIELSQEASRLEQVLDCALVDSPAQLKAGQDRASYAWEGLRTHMGGSMESLTERPGAGTITAWPYGQVMTAALNQAKLSGDYTDFDQLVQGLERYRHPDGGYSPSPGRFGFHGNRFMDDNAWLGLVFVQAAQQQPESGHLERAREIADFLNRSRNPDGGLIWEEGNRNPSYNTATFGPTIQLNLRLHKLTGEKRYVQAAADMTRIMDRELRRPDGLYADNLDLRTKNVESTIWSYNQGTPVGVHLQWYELTGDVSHLEKARETARAALNHYGQDGLWKQPPAFNAILFRNLMKLEDPTIDGVIDGYLERAWSQALDPETGLFNKPGHGMGSYEGHGDVSTLDQAALTQILSLRSWPKSELSQVS